MIRSFLALYRRYAAAHTRLKWAARPILDNKGRPVGHLERAELHRGQLEISGWVQADRVTLRAAGQEDSVSPRQLRPDVFEARGLPPEVGFHLALACRADEMTRQHPPELHMKGAHEVDGLLLKLAPARRTLLAEAIRLQLAFVRDGLTAFPSALAWLIGRDPRHRAIVKRRLKLDLTSSSGRLDPAVLIPGTAPSGLAAPATIILPVYNGFELLPEVLNRVRENSGTNWRLILVEDCSSDRRVRPFLRNWVASAPQDQVRLVENATNLGFIGSVNAGIALALEAEDHGPVVLLNSDAMVPDNWLPRLCASLNDPTIASATPMSNDAEILSVPTICSPASLTEGQAEAIDTVAQSLAAGSPPVVLPTGVGFCMALSRHWLAHEPRLDPEFGRGYGEEVDWCQKTRALGARHVAVPNLFVEHRGGTSFGLEKAMLVAQNNLRIAKRYPTYDRQVQDFIASDPLRTPRLALGLAWAGSREKPLPIYLAHSLGGGAEHYLQRRISADLMDGQPSLILRVGGVQRWRLELVTPEGTTSGGFDDIALLHRLLKPVSQRHIIYSCGVGDVDPLELPTVLRELKRDASDKVEMLFHDYLPLSPSYTLLDSDGIYRGPVTSERCDPAHRARRPNGGVVTIGEWQAAWNRLASCADELRVFSEDGRRQVTTAWPELETRVRVVPHALPHLPPAMKPTLSPTAPVLGILGNIGRQKGAAVVQELARSLSGSGVKLVLVGNIDPAYPLPRSVRVTGNYRPADIARHGNALGVTHWLIPSIWPETFCYTVHEALATTRPVLAFDIGAQGAAVREAGNGHPLPFEPEVDALVAHILAATTRAQTYPIVEERAS